MAMTCPNCGAKSDGKFCAHCGGVLESMLRCSSCSNQIPAGGRFCNMCGTPAVPGAVGGGSVVAAGAKPNLPWVIAGLAVVGLVAALLIPRGGGDPEPAAPPMAAAPAGPMGDASAVDLSSMTPQEQANRLFNRVMESVSSGDSAQARAFAPMAVAAYEALQPKSADEMYHLAMMHLINNNPEGTLAVTEQIQVDAPNHLYALFTAAQAHTLLGDRAQAATLYRQFVTHYDEEIAAGRPEYTEHQNILPAYLAAAQEQASPE